MLRVAIAGCAGRMGKALVQAIQNEPNIQVTAASLRPNHALLGTDVGIIAGITPLALYPVTDLSQVIQEFDVVIDFTTPETTSEHLRLCQQHHKKLVLGTTGLSAAQKAQLEEYAKEIALVFAPNTSVGMNACFHLIEQAAAIFGDTVDIEIIESHHRNKVDAPSGTALRMGEIISAKLDRHLDEVGIYGRHGHSGVRDGKTIGFSSIRAGDLIGDHTVIFACEGEQLEITHRATSRANFAHGALLAAQWLQQQAKGLFEMRDVLALKKS